MYQLHYTIYFDWDRVVIWLRKYIISTKVLVHLAFLHFQSNIHQSSCIYVDYILELDLLAKSEVHFQLVFYLFYRYINIIGAMAMTLHSYHKYEIVSYITIKYNISFTWNVKRNVDELAIGLELISQTYQWSVQLDIC